MDHDRAKKQLHELDFAIFIHASSLSFSEALLCYHLLFNVRCFSDLMVSLPRASLTSCFLCLVSVYFWSLMW